jgi:hypothetical protein
VVDHTIRPKSVARDLFERAMTFTDYIGHYGLPRSEGLVLRYLTDAYKGLVQNVPEDAKTDELLDLTEWLGELVRQVDSSLLDEWEQLRHPDAVAGDGLADPAGGPATAPAAGPASTPTGVTGNVRAFRVMVRNELFRWVELMARRAYAEVAAREASGWTAEAIDAAMTGYWDEHDAVGIGPEARSAALSQVAESPDGWTVRQALDDPAGHRDWAVTARVDLAASDEEGRPVVSLVSIGPDVPAPV